MSVSVSLPLFIRASTSLSEIFVLT